MALTRKPPPAKAPSAVTVGPNAAKSGAMVSGVFLQSSTYATPIPIVYGSARVAPNLIHLSNLAQLKSPKKATKVGIGGQNFAANIVLALCEGPIAGYGLVWKDRNAPVLFSAFEAGSWTAFLGTSSQAAWSHLPAAEQVPYQFVAYLAGLGVTLPGGAPSSYSVLVQGLLPFGGAFKNSATGTVAAGATVSAFNSSLTQADDYFDSGTVIFTSGANINLAYPVQQSLHASGKVTTLLAMANAPANGDTFVIIPSGDASPADIFVDLLENVQYGLGIPAGYLGSMTQFYAYCAAAGLFMSPVYDMQQSAAQTIDELLLIANSALVWSDGLMKIIPYGDSPLTGNGQTFTPNTTPLYLLTDDDFLPGAPGSDPIKVTRKRPADAYNRVTVTFEDNSAASGYVKSVAQAQDLASIQAYGIRDRTPVDCRAVRSAIVAQQLAQLLLQREAAVRNVYTFKLGWARGSLVEPMDLLEITDKGLGLNALVVRVTLVTELGGEAGFEITCEDWPDGIATAVAFPTQIPQGYQPNANIDPGNTVSPVIFEGPQPLLASPLEIWIGGSGGANWGGCDVYFSTDNVTFTKVGSLTGKATFGTLTANLAAGPQWPSVDNTHTLSIDLTPSGGQVISYSTTDFNSLTPLCYVDGEFLLYKTATLTSAEHYDLTVLGRGLYATSPGLHLSGTAFVQCDQQLLKFQYPKGVKGQTVYFKFPAWNNYGLSTQSLGSVGSVSHVIGQPPNIVQPMLQVVITQTSSIGSSVSFSVTVLDPTNQTTSATVFVDWQGLTGLLDLFTSLPVAASYTATIGLARNFQATLNLPFAGNGYAKFHAVAPNLFDGYGTWYSSSADQNANPAVVISIATNDSVSVATAKASAVVSAPSNTASIKWLASTSSLAAVSRANVIATGAVLSGGGPFQIADLGVNLALGDTVYLGAVYYDGAGTAQTLVQAQAMRASLLATKTATWNAAAFHSYFTQGPVFGTYTIDVSGNLTLTNGALNTVLKSDAFVSAQITLPNGITILSVSSTIFSQAATGGAVNLGFVRQTGNASTGLGGVSATPGLGWQTLTLSLGSEVTTGNSYVVGSTFGGSPTTVANSLSQSTFSVTYTMPDTTKTL